jgi:hypothetical protein
LRFQSLRHIQESRLHAGVASPGYEPLGDSSPLQRRTSCKPFRPCFMPERPWDSPYRAFPPKRCRTCLQAVALVSLRKSLPSFSSEEEKETREVDRLQSVAHRSDPYPPDRPKADQRADALMRLGLPRVFSPGGRRGQAPNSHALQTPCSPRRGPGSPRRTALRSITNRRIGIDSLEPSDPSEVFDLFERHGDKNCTGQGRIV